METEQKLLFHNYRSTGWLIVYGIAEVSRSWGEHISLITDS